MLRQQGWSHLFRICCIAAVLLCLISGCSKTSHPLVPGPNQNDSFETGSVSNTQLESGIPSVETGNITPLPDGTDAYVENEVLVVLHDDVESRMGDSFFDSLPLRTVRNPHLNWGTLHRMYITDGTSVEAMVERLSADPGVRFAEPNYLLIFQEAPYFPNDPMWEGSDPGDDPRDSVYDQWGPAKLGADIVWNDTKGADVIVAVIDTGIRLDHEDLQANIWINEDEIPDNGIDDDENGWIDDWRGWDTHGGDNDPSDSGSHGTGCAGIIGAVQDNDVGMSGIAPHAKIMALRADMWDGPSCVATVVEAWDYAKTNGADIVSHSFLVLYPTEALEIAANDTWDNGNGPLLIAAAGNSNNTFQYVPASYDSVICVGATVPWSRWNVPVDEDRIHVGWEGWWWGSNYGDNLDVMGFGEKTITTHSASPSAYRTGYSGGFFNGTSCACPTVAGVTALMVSMHPGMQGQWYWDRLEETADDLNVPGYDIQTGHGRVNALRAVYGSDRFSDLEDEFGFVKVLIPGTIYDSIHDRPGNPHHDTFDLYRISSDTDGCVEVDLDIFTFGEDLDIALYADPMMNYPLIESSGPNHADSSHEFLSFGVQKGMEYYLSVYSPDIGNSTTYGLHLEYIEDSITLTGESLSPVSVVAGEKFVPVLRLDFDILCNADLDEIIVHKQSSNPGGTPCGLSLYMDSNYNGTWEIEDTLLGIWPDIDFNIAWFSNLDLHWDNFMPLKLFVVANFAPSIPSGTTIRFSLENYKDVTILSTPVLDYRQFPIQSNTVLVTN